VDRSQISNPTDSKLHLPGRRQPAVPADAAAAAATDAGVAILFSFRPAATTKQASQHYNTALIDSDENIYLIVFDYYLVFVDRFSMSAHNVLYVTCSKESKQI